MRWLLPLLLLFATPLASPGLAQEPPACNASRDGVAACIAGKLCTCGYQRGGTIAGRPDAWRWDCGIMRPSCGPATAPQPQGYGQPQLMPNLYMEIPQRQDPRLQDPRFQDPRWQDPRFR